MEKGINFMQIYANNHVTKLNPHWFYANYVRQTTLLELPTIPNPLTSHPPLCSVPSTNSSPSHLSRQQSSVLLLFFHIIFLFTPPPPPHHHQPIIPLQPFSPSASVSAHPASLLSNPAPSTHPYILPSHLPFVILLFIPPPLIPLCTAWLLVV